MDRRPRFNLITPTKRESHDGSDPDLSDLVPVAGSNPKWFRCEYLMDLIRGHSEST